MELKFKRDVLLSALQTVAGVIPTRTPKDILKNTKLVVENNSAVLMGTDAEIGMRYEISEVETGSTGEVLLPTSRLIAILREVTSDEIVLDVNESLVEITAGDSQFKLPAADPREFPDVSSFDAEQCYVVSGHALRQAIRRVVFAADDESTRYALGGIYMEISPTQLILAATDSRRLAVVEIPAGVRGDVDQTISLVLPRKAMTLLERSIEGDESEILIAPSENEVLAKSGHSTLFTRLVEGRFPNFRDVLPSETPNRVELIAGPFHNLVRQSQIVTSDESRGVDFIYSNGLVTLVSQAADVGESKVQLPVGYEGEEIGIMFDPRFVSEFLRVLEPETTIELGLTGGEDPAVFRCGEEYKYVIMPLARES